jgi:hypothetical protein
MAVAINHVTAYVSGYTETDPNGMLSGNSCRQAGHTRAAVCIRKRMLLDKDKMYLIEIFREMSPLWDQTDKNYHKQRSHAKTFG